MGEIKINLSPTNLKPVKTLLDWQFAMISCSLAIGFTAGFFKAATLLFGEPANTVAPQFFEHSRSRQKKSNLCKGNRF